MGTLANSKERMKCSIIMQHNAAFHLSLHCLLRLKQPSRTDIHHKENSTCDPLTHLSQMEFPSFINWTSPFPILGFFWWYFVFLFKFKKKLL